MKKIILSIVCLGLLSLMIFFAFSKITSDKNPSVIINNKIFSVEIANSPKEHAKGLSNRESLPENAGMLFIFENTGFHSFWMKDTLIPLDMIFINGNRIVTIHTNAQPQPNVSDSQLKTYAPKEKINYVLEINGGLSEKYGFKEGDNVVYENLRY